MFEISMLSHASSLGHQVQRWFVSGMPVFVCLFSLVFSLVINQPLLLSLSLEVLQDQGSWTLWVTSCLVSPQEGMSAQMAILISV